MVNNHKSNEIHKPLRWCLLSLTLGSSDIHGLEALAFSLIICSISAIFPLFITWIMFCVVISHHGSHWLCRIDSTPPTRVALPTCHAASHPARFSFDPLLLHWKAGTAVTHTATCQGELVYTRLMIVASTLQWTKHTRETCKWINWCWWVYGKS